MVSLKVRCLSSKVVFHHDNRCFCVLVSHGTVSITIVLTLSQLAVLALHRIFRAFKKNKFEASKVASEALDDVMFTCSH